MKQEVREQETQNTKILKYIESISYFTVDEDNMVSTREHGDVGNETPGVEDIKEANRLLGILIEKYPNYKFVPEIIDEWVSIEWLKKEV